MERNKGCAFCRYYIKMKCIDESNKEKKHPLELNKDCTCPYWKGKIYESKINDDRGIEKQS